MPAASKPSKLGMQREHANMGRKGRTMVATINGRSCLPVKAKWVEKACEAPGQTGEQIMVLRAERLAVQHPLAKRHGQVASTHCPRHQ